MHCGLLIRLDAEFRTANNINQRPLAKWTANIFLGLTPVALISNLKQYADEASEDRIAEHAVLPVEGRDLHLRPGLRHCPRTGVVIQSDIPGEIFITFRKYPYFSFRRRTALNRIGSKE